MCGIVGFNWEDKGLVRNMAKTLVHRGPDQEGHYTDRHISLGHRRLSIIDLSERGRQPICNEDKSVWITYNGEIYNFMELREELEKKGHRFQSDTDSEAIVHAYEEFGEGCLSRLNGMFAFALWDSKQKKLFCARDRLGIKPFYYYWDGNKLIFASEIKAILLPHPVGRVVDKKGLSYFLAYGYNPTNHSLFKNILKLMPGCSLTYKNNKLEIKKYWQIDFSEKIRGTEDFFIKKIRRYIEESVKSMLIADVPVGAFLSGGVDSSSIVAMASKHIKNMKTFSVSFSEDGFDESKYALLVSEKFNTDHYSLDFKAEDIIRYFHSTLQYFDEPLADTSIVPHYLISGLARKHVKLVLTGEGGDESFAGYHRYIAYKKLYMQKYVPSSITKTILKPISNIPSQSRFMKRLKIFTDYSGLKDYEIFSKTWSNVGIPNNSKLLERNVLFDISKSYKRHFKYKSAIDNVLNSDINNYLHSDLLNLTDTTSMAHALEARVPFLDHRFMEFSSKIPPNLKLKGNETKYILKKALRGILPNEVIYREKKGFNTPLENYFKNELKSFVYDALSSKEFKNIGLFNQKNVLKMVEDHNTGIRDHRQAIFTLLVLQRWFEQWRPSLVF